MAQGDGAEAAGAPGGAPSHDKTPVWRRAEVSTPKSCCGGGMGLFASQGTMLQEGCVMGNREVLLS